MKMMRITAHGVLFLLVILSNGLHEAEAIYPLSAPPGGLQIQRVPYGLGLLSEQLEARSAKRVQGALHQLGFTQTYQSPLKKKTLGGDAKCNDGSHAGIYFRLSDNSRRWILYLEGGWYCFDQQSCTSRWSNSRHLMSSEDWPESKKVGGILSANPIENPHWWKANHVYVPYCSSDCWSGTYVAPRNGKSFKNLNLRDEKRHIRNNSVINAEEFNFLGSVILDEVIKNMIHLGLKSGHSLILAGSSAGGLGVLLNLDRMKDYLNSLGVDVDLRGVVDSAWFLDKEPYAQTHCQGRDSCAEIQAIKNGISLWRGNIHKECQATLGSQAWQCYLGYKIYPFLKAPLFIFQWIFDEAQMIMDNVGKPLSKKQWNYIHDTGERIKMSLNNVSVVFAPSCISHTAITNFYWSSVKIQQVSLPDALHCWSLASDSQSLVKSPIHPQKTATISQPKSPLEIASNDSKPQPHKIRHNRKKKRCRKCKGSKKRARRKSRRDKILHKDSFNQSILSSGSMLADSPRTNSKKSKTSSSVASNDDSQTVPHKQRISKKRKDKYRKKKRKRRRKNKRRQRKRQRKLKRRKNKKNNPDALHRLGVKTGGLRLQTSRDKRDLLPQGHSEYSLVWKSFGAWDDSKDEASPQKDLNLPLKEDPINSKLCPSSLVDSCSWPHCNPTCPPLINPYTGEEMNRVQLLKSFGLNMGDFAHALGIDLATLKAMDNKDIVLILTP